MTAAAEVTVAAGEPEERTSWLSRVPPLPLAAGLYVALALPFVIALVALSRDRWYPVLDLAMTELRVRDVGTSHTPLIGLPGRIGVLPDQGSHPGPLSFWLLAPIYRLLGQTAGSLEVGTVVVHLVVIALILWCAYQIAGRTGLVVAAVIVALLTRGYGSLLLIQPWNPYFPLLAWLLTLCATVAVLSGHHRWFFAVAAAASFCAQTHVPYLILGVAMFVLAAGAIAIRARRSDGAQRSGDLRLLGAGTGLAVLLWLAPIGQELFGSDDGNLSRLVDHFSSPSETPLGFGEAIPRLLRHLNLWEAADGMLHDDGGIAFLGMDTSTPWWPGALLLIGWIVAAVAAWRLRHQLLLAMHAVVAVGLVLTWVSIARIFGEPWYYLTLWAWGFTALMTVAIVATAVTALRTWGSPSWQRPALAGPIAAGLAGIVLLASTVAFSVDASEAEHPEQHLSVGLGPLVEPTYEAILDGVGAAPGADGRYLVRWSDAQNFGSPGYGLLNELDRLGIDVGADVYFHVPVTNHRVMLPAPEPEGSPNAEYPVADAVIQYAAGAYVDEFRADPDAVEVARFDPRSEEGRRRYAELRSRLLKGLGDAGLDDLLEAVDRNLFIISNERVPPRLRQIANEMIRLGDETAVFILPLDRATDGGG